MNNAIYSTKDFYLTAYMIASGLPLARHERHDGSSVFYFYKTSQLDELANRYYHFDAQVNPLSFASACKNLKNTMYNTTQATTNTNDNILQQQFRKD